MAATDELEEAARSDATRSALHLLAADPAAPRRRVVLALDVPADQVSAGGGSPSSVVLAVPPPFAAVVSVHVDEDEDASGPQVAAAVAALAGADVPGGDVAVAGLPVADGVGDPVDAVGELELLWYDVSEVGDLLA